MGGSDGWEGEVGVGWGGVERGKNISSVLPLKVLDTVCGSSGEGRAGAWEFKNDCICMLLRVIQQAIA